MTFKRLIFSFFLLILFLLKNAQINAKETQFDKIKNVIKAMLEINTNITTPVFFLKFKKIIMKFIRFSYFDLSSKDLTFIQDDINKSKYILNNITITFKSEIEINNFSNIKTELLMEVCFDTIIFINKNDFLTIDEIIPKSLFISENSQIGQLSYFNEFNNMNQTATFIDENGKKTENVDIISTFLDLSKQCLFKKISYIQKSFNLLTYDLDKILNNIIGTTITTSKYIQDIYKISSVEINKIDMPLKSIHFDNDNTLIIDNMITYGQLFYYEDRVYKIINFKLLNNEDNNAYFEKNYFEIGLNKNYIVSDHKYPKIENIFNVLNSCLYDLIEKEVNNYYS